MGSTPTVRIVGMPSGLTCAIFKKTQAHIASSGTVDEIFWHRREHFAGQPKTIMCQSTSQNPIVIKHIPPGDYIVRVRGHGFLPWEGNLCITSEDSMDIIVSPLMMEDTIFAATASP